MFCRAQQLAFAAFLTVIPSAASAQIIWQPASPPAVTAENLTWFIAGEPVIWNGALYYPVGIPRALDRYQMVRSGSYRGIPLYTDPMLEPNSTVFVPLAGARVQPYERPGAGMIAGTQGRPSPPPTDFDALDSGVAAQVPAMAPPYDPATVAAPGVIVTAPPAMVGSAPSAPPLPVGTSGRSAALASARTVSRAGSVTTVVPPTGANTIWIEFDGRKWYGAKRSIAYNASRLNEVGTYRGWTVYSPKNDPSIIYIPSTPGRLSGYKRR